MQVHPAAASPRTAPNVPWTAGVMSEPPDEEDPSEVCSTLGGHPRAVAPAPPPPAGRQPCACCS